MVQRGKSRKTSRKPLRGMAVVHPLAVGIDIASEEHWVCCPETDGSDRKVVKFGTTTSESAWPIYF